MKSRAICFILATMLGCAEGGDPPAGQQQSTQPSQSTTPPPTTTSRPPIPEEPIPVPAPKLVTLQFIGTNSIGGAEGSFSYDLEADPMQTNRGGLNNQIYHPLHWNLIATSTREDLLPSIAFSDQFGGHTAEWCIGTCLASPRRMAILTVKEPGGLGLSFAFELASESNLPPSNSQLGPFVQAIYGVLGSVPIALFETGSLTEAAQPKEEQP